jgi:hypothetical protein
MASFMLHVFLKKHKILKTEFRGKWSCILHDVDVIHIVGHTVAVLMCNVTSHVIDCQLHINMIAKQNLASLIVTNIFE